MGNSIGLVSETPAKDLHLGLRRWAIVLGLVCLSPAALLLLGLDFSTDVAANSQLDGVESAHRVLRGSYTHTLLEWTAVCFAAFAGGLASSR
jgi:hypothetical protein